MKRETVLFATIFLCLGFLFQGSRGIWQPDEGYYVGTSVTMLEKGSLSIPFLGEDEIFLDKPPLIYWGIIGGLKIFGHNEFAVRFFHGSSYVLTCILVGLLSYSMFGKRYMACLAGLIYGTMIVPFFAANFVTPDTLLALWTTASMYCFWRSVKPGADKAFLWKIFLCISVGVGFLAKGPAVIIPCGGMFVYLLLRKEAFGYFFSLWSIAGFLIFCVVGLGWYVWISFKMPGAYDYLFDSQIWGRLVSERYHRNPGLLGALMYVPVILFGSLPWSAIWLDRGNQVRGELFTRSWWRGLLSSRRRLFLVTVFFVPLSILCLASSKLGLYSLPLFAPLSVAAAKLWYEKACVAEDREVSFIFKNYKSLFVKAGVWVLVLIGGKFGLVYYPSGDDMRRLSEEIKKATGQSSYELCTVGDRADGLLFYGISELEHLTNEEKSYPSFTKTEHVLEEINLLIKEGDGERGILLVSDEDELTETRSLLDGVGVKYQVNALSWGRSLLVLRLFEETN